VIETNVRALVLVEQDGAWRIAVFHNTLVAQPPAR
jgi:hypothetical protein